MDRDANYVAVGAFVLLVVAMAVSFVFWYTEERDKRSYERYEIYFQGTVSGLTRGSPVRYLGVDVGKVARIMLDPQQRNQVLVIADIDSTAPIDSRTLASLNLQGVTGLLFIDLQQDRKVTASGPLAQGQQYPIIRSVPSDLDVLLSSLPDLHGLAKVTAPDVEAALANVRHVTESLAATSDHLDRFVADNEPGLSRFANQSLPQFEQLLRESRAAARDFRDLSRSLKQNPSQLLYETNSRGVEVPR